MRACVCVCSHVQFAPSRHVTPDPAHRRDQRYKEASRLPHPVGAQREGRKGGRRAPRRGGREAVGRGSQATAGRAQAVRADRLGPAQRQRVRAPAHARERRAQKRQRAGGATRRDRGEERARANGDPVLRVHRRHRGERSKVQERPGQTRRGAGVGADVACAARGLGGVGGEHRRLRRVPGKRGRGAARLGDHDRNGDGQHRGAASADAHEHAERPNDPAHRGGQEGEVGDAPRAVPVVPDAAQARAARCEQRARAHERLSADCVGALAVAAGPAQSDQGGPKDAGHRHGAREHAPEAIP